MIVGSHVQPLRAQTKISRSKEPQILSVCIPSRPHRIGQPIRHLFCFAGLGVATYRLVSYWLPIPLGAASYLSLRFWTHPAAARAEMQRAVERARQEAGQARRDGAVIIP